MDIHKPKPWHGIREFLKEYMIIVVGVLTALGGEQAVEWLHWRHVAEQADRKLAEGVSADVFNALLRVAMQPCVKSRTLELSKALLSDEPAWRGTTGYLMPNIVKSALPPVIREPKGNYARNAWDVAVAQGAILHLPDERVSAYSRIYGFSQKVMEQETAEGDLEARLVPLAYDQPLSREQRTGFLTVLAQLDYAQTREVSWNQRIISDAGQLKVKPLPGLKAALAQVRAQRGPCVQDIDYPGA